jgi:hypothetical protein
MRRPLRYEVDAIAPTDAGTGRAGAIDRQEGAIGAVPREFADGRR